MGDRPLFGGFDIVRQLVSVNMDPSVQAAWVAVVGTLVGSASGAGIQAWFSSRALDAARDDALAQRHDSQAALDRTFSEERLSRLWTERRALFSRVLQATDEWRRANLDLAGITLSDSRKGEARLEMMTMASARDTSPEVARALDCMYGFGRLMNEIHMLSEAETRGAVANLQSVLRNDMKRAAVESANSSVEVAEAEELVRLAMRREIITES